MEGSVLSIETDQDLDDILKTAGDTLVLIDFYAVWCGPCKMISPMVAQLSTQYTNVIFLKVDVDRCRSSASKHGITAMPTFQFFRNNSKVFEFKGASIQKLQEALSQYATPPSSSASGPNVSSTPKESKPSGFATFNQDTYIVVDSGKLEAIFSKIIEFNDALTKENKSNSSVLNNEEIKILGKLADTLKNPSYYHASKVQEMEGDLLLKLVTSWPSRYLFPVLDFARCLMLHPDGVNFFGKDEINTLIGWLKERSDPILQLMILRILTNAFKNSASRGIVIQMYNQILDSSKVLIKSEDKRIRSAVVTLFLNYSIAFRNQNHADSAKSLAILAPLLISESDEEIQYRLLITLGIMSQDQKKISGLLKPFKSDIQNLKTSQEKVIKVRSELVQLLDMN